MGIIIKGEIVWMGQREVKFKKDGKDEKFTERQYMIAENEDFPVTVKSTTKNGRKKGDKVEIPVKLKTWMAKDGRQGHDFVELERN